MGGNFGIFMVILLAVQSNARNVLVSLWYCTFLCSAVFDRLPGQDSNENYGFGSIYDVLNIRSTPPPLPLMYYVLYWHRLKLLEYVCLSVCLSSFEAYRHSSGML